MRILFRWTPVCRPPGVTDAVLSVDRIGRKHLLEPGKFASASSDLYVAASNERKTRRVIAAVLQPPQTIDQNGNNRFGAEIADDAAHDVVMLLCLFP